MKKAIHHIDRKWTVALFSKYYNKVWGSFCLSIRKTLFLKGLILKPKERAYVLLKSSTRGFQNTCWHLFMWQSLEVLVVFNALTLKQIFWKKQKLFLKNWSIVFSWKYQDWNALFPYKTSLLKTNVTINRMKNAEWQKTENKEYDKRRSFTSNYFN